MPSDTSFLNPQDRWMCSEGVRCHRSGHRRQQSFLLLGPPPKWETLKPVLEERCYDCHGGIKTKAALT